MKKYFNEFVYFNNETNYLKNLSKKDNHKYFNEMIQIKKKASLIQLFIFISTIIIFESILIYVKQKYLNLLLMIISIFALFNLISKILVINYSSNTYKNFIKLCELIINFENKIKNKIKIISMMKISEEDIKLILFEITEEIKFLINVNNETDSNNKNKVIKDINYLFNDYQNLKIKLFKYIFFIYEKEFIIRELYIIKYIKIFFNYSKSINYKLDYLINTIKNILQKINIGEIDFDSLFKEYEKYINNNKINSEENQINKLKVSINNLFESNYKLNENYINLIKEINKKNYSNDKIIEMIEYILEKNKLSISLLEQIKTGINKENDIINDNENIENENNVQNNFNNKIKVNRNKNNNFTLTDFQLNSLISDKQYSKEEEIFAKNEYKNINKNIDIIKEKEKIISLKSDFIDELNKYYKSKNNSEISNKTDKEIKNENFNLIKENKESKEKDNEFNKLKMDFTKSLTMCLKNNKNFAFNFSKEN